MLRLWSLEFSNCCSCRSSSTFAMRFHWLACSAAWLLVVAFAASASASASAPSVVYVDGVHGADTNPGTIDQPFATINHTVAFLCTQVEVGPWTAVIGQGDEDFIYTDDINWAADCATLDVTFTGVAPDRMDENEPRRDASELPRLDVRIGPDTFNGAPMNLVFDNIVLTGTPFIGTYPSVDLGSTAQYNVTLRRSFVVNGTAYNVMFDFATTTQLGSGITFIVDDVMVRDSPLGTFVYTAAGTPISVYITNSQFINTGVASYPSGPYGAPLINANAITVLAIDNCTFHNNYILNYQMIYSQGVMNQGGTGAPPPSFSFTRNFVTNNTMGVLMALHNGVGTYVVDSNVFTNNIFPNATLYNYGATSYFTGAFTGQPTPLPFAITNNAWSCNVDSVSSSWVAFFARDSDPSLQEPWTLGNNKNDPSCPIVAISGYGLADPIDVQACPAGSYSNNGACTSCAAGSFSSASASLSCTPCTPGTFASTTGLTTCTQCAIGTHAQLSGATQCADCNSGHFASQPGEVICQVCGSGTCTPSSGAWAQCQPAPCNNHVGEKDARKKKKTIVLRED